MIVNHAAMPLEFQLSSSLPPSELNFSLSAATLKQFKSVHVEAKTRLQARDKLSRGYFIVPMYQGERAEGEREAFLGCPGCLFPIPAPQRAFPERILAPPNARS